MKELREKLHKAIDEYGRTDERTVAISQELDKVVCKEQKKLIKPRKDLIWMACDNTKYQLPIFIGNSASELGKIIGVSKRAIYNAIARNGGSNGYKIIRVDISDGEREIYGL